MDYYQRVADRLVSDGYLLTALELYTEFAERGFCLKSLKDFFEDSSNFDQFTRRAAAVPTTTSSSSAALESPVPSLAGSQVSYCCS